MLKIRLRSVQRFLRYSQAKSKVRACLSEQAHLFGKIWYHQFCIPWTQELIINQVPSIKLVYIRRKFAVMQKLHSLHWRQPSAPQSSQQFITEMFRSYVQLQFVTNNKVPCVFSIQKFSISPVIIHSCELRSQWRRTDIRTEQTSSWFKCPGTSLDWPFWSS